MRREQTTMTGKKARPAAVWSLVLLLVPGSPLPAHANCMCMIIPFVASPFLFVGLALTVTLHLIARFRPGPKRVLAIVLTLGAVLAGIPAALGTAYAIWVAITCGHRGAGWSFAVAFSVYLACMVLAGRAIARRQPESCMPCAPPRQAPTSEPGENPPGGCPDLSERGTP